MYRQRWSVHSCFCAAAYKQTTFPASQSAECYADEHNGKKGSRVKSNNRLQQSAGDVKLLLFKSIMKLCLLLADVYLLTTVDLPVVADELAKGTEGVPHPPTHHNMTAQACYLYLYFIRCMTRVLTFSLMYINRNTYLAMLF